MLSHEELQINSSIIYPRSDMDHVYDGVLLDHTEGDRSVKLWFFLAVLWFAFFTTFGLILAIKFFFPLFLSQQYWLTFGVVRPAHVNGVLFGFITSGLLGAMYYIVPRLCAVRLRWPRLAYLIPILWNASVLAGVIWILLGGSQGREYAELPFAIDVAIMVTLILQAIVIIGTISYRLEKKLFGSLWYYAGTVIWFPIIYFIGNVMWHPATGSLNGVPDAIFNWYYGHNVLGLWFTTLGIPAIYYSVPRIIKRPLYSHALSLIGFFSIAFFYTGVGGHHLLQAPLPEWLKTMAVVMTMLMLVPVIAFGVNITLTMRGSWKKVASNPILMFILFGAFNYVISSVQGTFQGIRFTNQYLHFSQWPVSHSHIALLGGFGFLAAGLGLWIVPQIYKARIYGFNLLKTSWWTASVGYFFFASAMIIAGLIQNANWWVHINVVETLPALKVPFVFRAISGGIVVVAAYMVAINILMTFIRRHSLAEAILHEQPDYEPGLKKPEVRPLQDEPEAVESLETTAVTAGEPRSAPVPPSRPQTAPVSPPPDFLRRSQREINLPVVFAGGLSGFLLMTFMVVAMPYMFTTNKPSDSPVAHQLSAVEATGEQVYKENGCFYCHNQFVREFDWAYGERSDMGDFFYSTPNFLGTERTGPPLGMIGGKRPTEWHRLHYMDPRQVSPSSIMPPFLFLSEAKLQGVMEYVQNLGGKNLEPNAYQPLVPLAYRGLTNPYMPLMERIGAAYDPNEEKFTGTDADAQEWQNIYETGKKLFTQKCISCHSCAGNGQGPYARQTVARPANLHERISNFPPPDDAYHNWRVSEGVPGTAMPPWGWSLDDDTIWKIATYEMSFVNGSLRTFDGGASDDEGDKFSDEKMGLPVIAGTQDQFTQGEKLFRLYCIVCHGADGKGNGPASIKADGGYIMPVPANFTESGSDFEKFGRYVWKVQEGVETTNMPPWKEALSGEEIANVVFYIQGFSTADDYSKKWAPLYSDNFAKNFKK